MLVSQTESCLQYSPKKYTAILHMTDNPNAHKNIEGLHGYSVHMKTRKDDENLL